MSGSKEDRRMTDTRRFGHASLFPKEALGLYPLSMHDAPYSILYVSPNHPSLPACHPIVFNRIFSFFLAVKNVLRHPDAAGSSGPFQVGVKENRKA